MKSRIRNKENRQRMRNILKTGTNRSSGIEIGNWKLHGRLVLTQIFFVQLTKILKLKQVSTIYGKFLDSLGTQLFKVELLNS